MRVGVAMRVLPASQCGVSVAKVTFTPWPVSQQSRPGLRLEQQVCLPDGLPRSGGECPEAAKPPRPLPKALTGAGRRRDTHSYTTQGVKVHCVLHNTDTQGRKYQFIQVSTHQH